MFISGTGLGWPLASVGPEQQGCKMAGVSGPSLVTTIQTEIERARQDLKGVDENLRRLTGRDFNDPK